MLNEKTQKKLQNAQSWAEVDRMTMNIMADRELEEYQKNKAYIDESKDRKSVQKSAPSSQVKWHQKTN
ncbi:hypothetical protein COT76_01415 [Candidatus Berkelbacteria bacterium CG10_big_fil_rev_8_21_14_0_10_33_10]|nr:MAG: hypothetical protein COT76_01415 [Candidatus Berkelbacteria bacterium CG10_big_fil_rev_8_21_14_0_10_33_10]